MALKVVVTTLMGSGRCTDQLQSFAWENVGILEKWSLLRGWRRKDMSRMAVKICLWSVKIRGFF